MDIGDSVSEGRFELPQPYLVFLGGDADVPYAKTGVGLRDWARDKCLGEFGTDTLTGSIGLPKLTPQAARFAGARSVVIGVASIGGAIAESWIAPLIAALEAGLDLVSGAHTPLSSVPEFKAAAERLGRRLVDVRVPPVGLRIGRGLPRPGNRLLTVGTDCALGKKYTALAIARSMQARGIDADFRATGQTGIMIAGAGIPIDAVVADFVAGAAEHLTPAAAADHWDVIEGQGSLFHPAYAGVSLGLLHGAQPDVFVLCHQAGRERMGGGFDYFPTPGISEAISLHLMLGRRTNPGIRCAGVSLNTAHLSYADANRAMVGVTTETGLPCADPIRVGATFEALIDSCLA